MNVSNYLVMYSAYTPQLYNNFRSKNQIYTTPKKGDIVFYYIKSLGRIGHVGIVEQVFNDHIITIEGNTSSDNRLERNGGGVYRKNHYYDKKQVGKGEYYIKGFARSSFIDDIDKDILLKIAKQEINTIEKSENITKYGDWFHMNGQPWCAMFVCWCLERLKEEKANAWQKINNSWQYIILGQNYIVNGWLKLSDRWYYFINGIALCNTWHYIVDNWYYFNIDCTMLSSQWLLYREKWYYLNSSGQCLVNTTDEINGKLYKFDDKGVAYEL